MSDHHATPGHAAPSARCTAFAARIVAAHDRTVGAGQQALLSTVYQTLAAIAESHPATARRQPAVPVSQSVFPDHLVCLEDGQPGRMLTRHLRAAHGMTPAQYRARWNLPDDYPMVPPMLYRRRSPRA